MTSRPPSRSAVDDVVDGHLDEVGLPEDAAVDRHAGAAAPAGARRARGRAGLVSSMVLAPGCFCTPTMTAGLPLREPSPRLSAPPSPHLGDVADEDRRARRAARPRLSPISSGDRAAADGLQHVLLRAFGEDAGRRVLARAADGVQQLGDRHAVGAQLVGMGDHLELPLGAADRRHLRHAGNGQQPPAHDGVGDACAASSGSSCRTRSRRTGSRP